MKLDPAFTQQVQDYLAQPIEQRDLKHGAELMLKMNRNRSLYRYILRRGDSVRLERELIKYLRIRLDGLTRREVYFLEKETLPRVRATFRAAAERYEPKPADLTLRVTPAQPDRRGKRPDHDFLPREVRELYEQNGDIYRRMRRTFETLKGMGSQTACDRYELVKMLAELDTRYRTNLQRYDEAPEPSQEEIEAQRAAEASAAAAADLGLKGTQEAAAAIIFGEDEATPAAATETGRKEED